MAEILTPDLCVIGAGAGGLAAVEAACALGASVVLVERGRLGGDYLNTGSIPAGALAAAGRHAQAARSGAPLGILTDEPRINTRHVYEHVQQVIAGIAPQVSAERIEALGAQLVLGEGRFLDPRTLDAGEMRIKARRFIIATGARSVVPAIQGLDAVPYFTGETIFDNTRKLTHLAVIGGGSTGLELAQAYQRLGTQVTVIEARDALPASDPELATLVLQRLREEGVDIRIATAVRSIQPRSQGIGVVVSADGREEMLDISHILVANGRVPNIEKLDLDKAGIRRSKADPHLLDLSPALRTSNRRVYAIGDAAGGPQYASVARLQAQQAVRHALLALPGATPALLPLIVNTDPGIGEVGLREAEARKKHGDGIKVLRAPFGENDRARSGRDAYGVAKIVIDRNGRLLGAGIVGAGAGDLIALLALAIGKGLNARDLAGFVPPHPSLAETIQRLGAEFARADTPSPLLQQMAALLRYLP